MDIKNDSLLEIAVSIMKKKKTPQTLDDILKESFKKKEIEKEENTVAQFEVDFMLSGLFVYCGEKDGKQLWDLKERQLSSLLDKDGGYYEDMLENDEEVKKNELKDDTIYTDEDIVDDDEVEDKEEEDDIADSMGLINEGEESSEIDSEELRNDEDEEEPEEEEDFDDIEEELKKRK